jgi:hypothetical protein
MASCRLIPEVEAQLGDILVVYDPSTSPRSAFAVLHGATDVAQLLKDV